jgi:hypothetical protein
MAVKKAVHTADEIKAVLGELEKQTDRGAAIIAASVIEELLAVVIQERLLLTGDLTRALFDRPNAPLSTFAAKIDLGFALGLYSDSALKHLHIIRECRNKFAHRIEALDFDHPDIQGIIGVLTAQPFFKAQQTTRERYFSLFRLTSILLMSECNENIRIVQLGQNRPDIFVGLFARIWPERAAELKLILEQLKQQPNEE